MYIKSAKLTFYLPQAGSLKDKRQVARSLIEKTRHKFNVSVCEVGRQDVHNALDVGISLVASDAGHGQTCLEEVIRFMDDYSETLGAELMEVEEN